MPSLSQQLARWRRDPAAFMTEALINPQTGRRFELFEAERMFLKHAFTPLPDGDLPYRDILWSCIKKSGKSTFGALCMLYTVICLGGPFAEAYVIANDMQQAADRIFTSAARIVEASPLLQAKVTADRITFSNGSFIQALASDYRSAAGVEPTIILADELWGFTSESSQRLYEEVTTTPTKKPSVRMVTSYAGFTGESQLLERLVKRGLAGEQIEKDLYVQPGMVAFVSHDRIAPWQTETWLEEARQSTRPSAFMRQYLNEFTSGESGFVDMDDFDRCVDPDARPILSDRHTRIFVGLDGSYQHDSTAIAAVSFDSKTQKVRLIAHKIFTPTAGAPVDFAAVEAELIRLRHCFTIEAIFFDPYQLVSLSQRMVALGLPMEPFTQTSSNLEAAATNLAELIRHQNLSLYRDPEVRLAMSRTVAVESSRGLKISKTKASHRIDIIAALSFACFAAVRDGQYQTDVDLHFQARAAQTFAAASAARRRGGGDIASVLQNRAYANGRDFCAAEDRAAIQAQFDRRRRWRSF